jgi:type I restriction enzyme, R subunit
MVSTITLEDPDPDRELPNEWTTVERPLLQQLGVMGWKYLKGDIDYPQKTYREHFRDVLLREPLRAAIRRINCDENLDDLTIDRAIRELEISEKPGGLERNKELLEKLIRGVCVQRAMGGDTAHSQEVTVRFFEFDPTLQDRNEFLAVNQFRIDYIGRFGFVIPDIILFVNGIPLVIIECKSPSLAETDDGGFWKPIESGIIQLLRYSNMREEVETDEGVEHLFHWNQLMISTCYYDAKVGTYGSGLKNYSEWKEITPFSDDQIIQEIGRQGTKLYSQEKLAAGMLRPAHLLDILRHFILFTVEDGQMKKLAPRYQQYRAVQKAVNRILTGKTREQDEKSIDRRGGIIWHTQGSGKSITMVHLVRKMRSDPRLRGFKVVIVTDRTSLEEQMQDTAVLTGERLRPDKDDIQRGESVSDRVRRILSEEGPDLVFCMIQKNQDRGGEVDILEYEVPVSPPRMAVCDKDHEYTIDHDGNDVSLDPCYDAKQQNDLACKTKYPKTKTLRQVVRRSNLYPELNKSEKILLLIDECHRSHTLTLHANLMTALPNAVKIGFTGTPIMNCDRNNTLSIFDTFIDTYKMKEAEADGATVPIIYEGRVPLGLVENAKQLDSVVRIEFSDFSQPEQQLIMRKFATERKVLEAQKVIRSKAYDILSHYIRNILPRGFKAQVVAVSQEAAVEYQKALCVARDELVNKVEHIDPTLLQLEIEDLLLRPEEDRTLVLAHRQLDRIKNLEFAAVISGKHNQSGDWDRWSDAANIKRNIENFKKPFDHSNLEKRSNLAMLCVMRMLLTGFDASVEQAMYLDRQIKEHDLLQAIARVNRIRAQKECGYVIDYVGIALELHHALTESAEASEGIQRPDTGIDRILDEIPILRERHQKVLDVFRSRGIQEIMPINACVELLEDEKIRAEFINKIRAFFASFAVVMPRPEALPFIRDTKILGFIAKVAANLYRDNQLNLIGIDSRIKQLINEYVAIQGIDPRIPPIEITDLDFNDAIKRAGSARAKASEMKHALRHHIRMHYNENPAHYRLLSERLEEILRRLESNWEELERVLAQFIRNEIEQEKRSDIPGLDPKMHAPFFGVLKETIEQQTGKEINSSDQSFKSTVNLTITLVKEIRSRIRVIDFWRDAPSRTSLEKSVYQIILKSDLIERKRIAELSTKIVDLARYRHRWLVWDDGKYQN